MVPSKQTPPTPGLVVICKQAAHEKKREEKKKKAQANDSLRSSIQDE